ncbi:hypothetical protein BWD11_13235 [Leptospira santarosai serovar Grippotyphosa]|nr:hypothetical protein BWD11_13235 [Leptospira santarosai serovar Grippotyphosa]
MSALYSIVGISKQAFHQRLNRHLGMQEELGYLLQIGHIYTSIKKKFCSKRFSGIGENEPD